MKKKATVLFIFGTRPEAIKLAPLIKEFQASNSIDVRICVTAQHRELLDQVLDFFKISPDYDLNIMKPGQTISDTTVNAVKDLEHVLNDCPPDLTIVQGDTTTTFVGALVSFYKQIPIAHIEAGLRSFDKYAPFPEEMNRALTTRLVDLHFAPTEQAKKNLLAEGVDRRRIHVVGNTVVDALLWTLNELKSSALDFSTADGLKEVDFSRKILLVTGHRRESFGEPFKNICLALKTMAEGMPHLEIVYPVHLNPNVRQPVFEILGGIKNVHLMEPLSYPQFTWLMSKSSVILTDSGGIQEEAPILGKPVLIMRDKTERVEGVKAGIAKIVGTKSSVITKEVVRLLTNKTLYRAMGQSHRNLYGDGKASKRIVKIVQKFLGTE